MIRQTEGHLAEKTVESLVEKGLVTFDSGGVGSIKKQSLGMGGRWEIATLLRCLPVRCFGVSWKAG